MKRAVLKLVFIFAGIIPSLGLNAKTKHALIFAIGNYPAANGWPYLSSINDAEYLKRTLIEDSFDEKHIRVVSDKQASVKGISQAFEQLINDVHKGDVAVVHFSCHGEQVEAENPAKLGGLDQCVVTYNALLPRLSTDFDKDQALYYRGQTIGVYLEALRVKLGSNGDVVIFMDYCHSGAGTRGVGRPRGGAGPFLSNGKSIKPVEKQASSDFYEAAVKADKSDVDLATFVAISATRPEEFDLETTDDKGVEIGSLTYAICRSFEHLDPSTTYRSLFARIQSVMNEKVPQQHPMLEGNGLDRALFGGKFVAQKPFVEIENFEDGNQLILKSGALAGLDTGSKIVLFKSGTIDPSKGIPLAVGKVIATKSFSSYVQLDRNPGISKPSDVWVFVTEPVYRIKPINVQIENRRMNMAKGAGADFKEDEVASLKRILKDNPLVNFDGTPELLLVKGTTIDSILYAVDGCLMDTITSLTQNPLVLNEKIKKYSKYKFIKEIELTNEDADVTVKLVPVINRKIDTNAIMTKMVNGVYEFRHHDTFRVVVRNNCNHDIYINILDLQPDGVINAVLPNLRKQITPDGLKIRAGELHVFDNNITVSPPFGTEIFKVFLSSEEIDMEGLATNGEARERGGGGRKRGNLSVMESLIEKSNGIRGVEEFNSQSADGSTFNLVFRIVP